MAGPERQERGGKRALLWALGGVLLLLVAAGGLLRLQLGSRFRRAAEEVSWPEFMARLKRGEIESVTVTGRKYRGQCRPGSGVDEYVAQGPEMGARATVRDEITKHAELKFQEPSRLLPWR